MRYLSLKEIKDLFFASFIIAFIVSIHSFTDFLNKSFYISYIIAFLILSISFILHEMAHKFTAIRYGMFAQFEISYIGLLFSLALKMLTGIILIIPGAVVIYKHFIHKSRKKEIAIQGVIALAGPLVNLALSLLSFLFYYISKVSFFSDFFYTFSYINAILLLFNLLPIPPLDGFKVARWSLPVYIPLFIFSLIWFYIISTL